MRGKGNGEEERRDEKEDEKETRYQFAVHDGNLRAIAASRVIYDGGLVDEAKGCRVERNEGRRGKTRNGRGGDAKTDANANANGHAKRNEEERKRSRTSTSIAVESPAQRQRQMGTLGASGRRWRWVGGRCEATSG